MKPEKLYFASEGDNVCYPIDRFIYRAKEEGLAEIELIEAVPSPENNYYWCCYYENTVEKAECKRTYCDHWRTDQKGKICVNRGKLYKHGDKVKIKVI